MRERRRVARRVDVVLDEVGVDGDRRRRAGAGGGDHLGAWIDDVAGRPDAAVRWCGRCVDDDEAGLVEVAPQAGEQAVGVGTLPGPDEHRGARR